MTRRTGRHAGYDREGYEILDVEVLAAEELAIDYGWISPPPARPIEPDPALVNLVAALQAGGGCDG